MTVFGAAGAQSQIGMLDYFGCIAEQFDVSQCHGLCQFQRADQRQPLGVAAGAMPQIVEQVWDAAHHYRSLDTPWIGAATTIKKYLQPSVRCGRFHR